MGEVASCEKCRCDDQDRKAISSSVHVKRLAFDAGHEEELSDLRATCKSWDPIDQSAGGVPRESAGEELPSLLRSPNKQRQTTYKDECKLSFTLDPAADLGLHLVATTPSWPRTALPLLVVRSVEANSPLARDIDGKLGILPGDALLEVNGCRGSIEELREAFRQVNMPNEMRIVTITVRPRPLAFNVNLQQDGLSPEKLGIAVVIDKTHPSCVRVKTVHDQGLIPSWNASHPLLCVCTGDLIAEVNSISGNATAMCQEIQAQATCQSGSLLFHIVTKASRGKENCPTRASAVVPPWRALMQSLDHRSKDDASFPTPQSANVSNLWNSSLQPIKHTSRFSL